MAILFSVKVFSGVINDQLYKRYSDPSFNELLGSAEKYFLEAKAINVAVGGTPTLVVIPEASNDNINWQQRTTVINQVLTQGAGGSVHFASDFAGAIPIGQFYRYNIGISNSQGTGAYLELWVTGRDAR